MTDYHKKKAVVLLADGTLFWGKATGLDGEATGEICFNTGMSGYQEIFTDPSYLGQIMVTTNAHIGNYGVTEDEVESDGIKIAGLICKNFSNFHSRDRSTGSLFNYFADQNKVAISDIDTRALVRHIRSKGAMNAIISTNTEDIEALRVKLVNVPSMEGLELSSQVSVKEPVVMGDENASYRIAVLDYGVKRNILRNLLQREAVLKVFPMDTPVAVMEEWNPDAYFISNGPGDPSVMTKSIELMKEVIASEKPVFGICLGHQLICLSQGLGTSKMHNGHRGINHPVINLQTGKGEITTQNHGFVVNAEDVAKSEDVILTHQHLNDKTVAGVMLKNKPVFCVQYHPEAYPGPHDSAYLFDDFIELIKTHKSN